MRTGFCVAIIVGLLTLPATAQETVAGEWMLTIDDQFGPNIMRLSLVVAGEKLTGTAGSSLDRGNGSRRDHPVQRRQSDRQRHRSKERR